MQTVVLVPGIMGTRLRTPDGDEVWPPTVLETQYGYHRKDQLLRDDLITGDIIRSVWCAEIYQPLIDQLTEIGFREGNDSDKTLKVFPYDWRQDLERTAEQLAKQIAELASSSASSVILIAHSMGGLICRLVLESGAHSGQPWFSKIEAFITLATPHLGAPLALARILGMDSTLGISGPDFRVIANDPRYPSAYQLLPAPGEDACWDVTNNELLPLDIYEPATAKTLGLNTSMIQRAKFVYDTLASGHPPKHVRYFCFAGTGHATTTRVNVTKSGNKLTTAEDAGDGTVPMWSALPRSLQRQLVLGEHSSFFTRRTFKAVFYRLLGATFPDEPIALAATGVDVSIQALVIEANQPIDLLLVPHIPAIDIQGSILLERTDDPSKPFVAVGAPVRVSYSGPVIPQLKMSLLPLRDPGQYRLRFEGKPGPSGSIAFAVARVK